MGDDEEHQEEEGPPLYSPEIAITLVVYGVLLLVSVGLVLKRRHLQPLRFRDPYLLVATITVTYLTNFMLPLTSPICPVAMLTFLPMLCMVVLLSARFLKLLLASWLTQARLANQPTAWILRYPWVSSAPILARLCALLIVSLFLVYLIVGLASPGCDTSFPVFVLSIVTLILYMIGLTVMLWKMRRIQDGFFVVSELRMLGLILLGVNIYLIVTMSWPPFILCMATLLQLIVQTWYPLWMSYRMAPASDAVVLALPATERTSRAPSQTMMVAVNSMTLQAPDKLTAASGLVDVLRHPSGYEAMKRFLTLEFSVENLLCWRQLEDGKQLRRPDLVRAHFNAIYETFVRRGAPNEVNIPAHLKNQFHEVYQTRDVMNRDELDRLRPVRTAPGAEAQPDSETDLRLRLLKSLNREIVRLMSMDTFQRFRQCSQYAHLIQATEQQEPAERVDG